MPKRTIEEALKESNTWLMSIPGVLGTAQALCDSKPCIRAYVLQISTELTRRIPDMINGYPVVVEEIGEIHLLPKGHNKGGELDLDTRQEKS